MPPSRQNDLTLFANDLIFSSLSFLDLTSRVHRLRLGAGGLQAVSAGLPSAALCRQGRRRRLLLGPPRSCPERTPPPFATERS